MTGSLPTGVHLVPHRSILGGEEARVVLAVMNRFDFVQQYTFRSLPSDIPVNPAPPPVQAGIEVVLSDELVQFLGGDASRLKVVDVLSGELINHTPVGTGLSLTLPSFEHMTLVVIEAR